MDGMSVLNSNVHTSGGLKLIKQEGRIILYMFYCICLTASPYTDPLDYDEEAVKARLIARTKAMLERKWNAPGFREEREAWLCKYYAEVVIAEARRKAAAMT